MISLFDPKSAVFSFSLGILAVTDKLITLGSRLWCSRLICTQQIHQNVLVCQAFNGNGDDADDGNDDSIDNHNKIWLPYVGFQAILMSKLLKIWFEAWYWNPYYLKKEISRFNSLLGITWSKKDRNQIFLSFHPDSFILYIEAFLPPSKEGSKHGKTLLDSSMLEMSAIG